MTRPEDAEGRCEDCDALPPARTYAEWRKNCHEHEKHVKRREAAKPQTKMPCKNCGRLTNLHLIDTSQAHGSPEREQRFCFGCRPEAVDDHCFVIDRTESYPLAERLKDLYGKRIQ
jgi:hypothetical protein